MQISDKTYQLTGYTVLRSLKFEVDASDGRCLLRLKLEKDESETDAIQAEFTGVADLSLRNFGGGLTQLLYLAIEDISAHQRDRVHYRVRDLERDMISFVCDGLSVKPALAGNGGITRGS